MAKASLVDVCPKCKQEFGAHDGKKCPKPAPNDPRFPGCTCRPKPIAGHFIDCPYVTPAARLSPKEARELGATIVPMKKEKKPIAPAAAPAASSTATVHVHKPRKAIAPEPPVVPSSAPVHMQEKNTYQVKRHKGVRKRPTFAITLSPDDVRRLDVIAASQGMTRSGWITAMAMQTFRARFVGMTLDEAEVEFPPKKRPE